MFSLDDLDKVPQIPGGPWANHAFYGIIGGTVAAVAVHLVGQPWPRAWVIGTVAIFALCAVKKVGDYVNRGPAQGETLMSCIGKTFVTAVGPALIALIS